MQTIYIGSNKKKYNLKQYRVYQSRPDTLIEGLKEKFSLIDQLFVAVDKFNQAESEMREAGNPRNIAFKQLETA